MITRMLHRLCAGCLVVGPFLAFFVALGGSLEWGLKTSGVVFAVGMILAAIGYYVPRMLCASGLHGWKESRCCSCGATRS